MSIPDKLGFSVLSNLSNIIEFFNIFSYIVAFGYLDQLITDIKKLPILLIRNELQNRDAIIKLEGKAMDQVINNHHILEIKLLDNPQVLDVKTVMSLKAMVSVEDCLYCSFGLV